tara:strand:+ start:288 stop:599 length:312 start_codon:yes stop_codon:yes gene_type:complete
MDSNQIETLRLRSPEFDKYCRKKNIRKRINQATILSVMEGTAIGLPLYKYNNSDHLVFQIGSLLYGLTIGLLGFYYPSLSAERIDEEIFEEAKRLDKLLDEEQ